MRLEMLIKKGLIMQILKEKICQYGQVVDNRIIKVDSFLNHQLDIDLFNEIGKEFKKRFQDKKITKILTIESSGIAIACITAQYFSVPVVFAKKHEAANLDVHTYQAEVYSFTKGRIYKVRVAKEYLNPEDKILIIDDFLAHGQAINGLLEIVQQAGAEVAGIGIVIEKGFQKGRTRIKRPDIQLESLAIIKAIEDGKIIFQ
jgi:xanthine phosphoribosyltransferase